MLLRVFYSWTVWVSYLLSFFFSEKDLKSYLLNDKTIYNCSQFLLLRWLMIHTTFLWINNFQFYISSIKFKLKNVRTVFLESCPNKVSPNLGRDKRPKLESAFQTWVRFDDGVSPNVKYNSLCAFLPLQKTIKHTVKQMMMVILVPATAITMIVENDSSCTDVKVSDKQ